MDGTTCQGTDKPPRVEQGYYGYVVNTLNKKDREDLGREWCPKDYAVAKCTHDDVCLGSRIVERPSCEEEGGQCSKCADGYDGFMCNTCAGPTINETHTVAGYYRLNGRCEPCPPSDPTIFVLFALLGVVALIAMP